MKRAFSFHRAVALTHIFCFDFALCDGMELSAGGLRRLVNSISSSFILEGQRLLCRQKTQLDMRKQIKIASASDMTRMTAVRVLWSFVVGFHPGGNESRMSGDWVGDGVVSEVEVG